MQTIAPIPRLPRLHPVALAVALSWSAAAAAQDAAPSLPDAYTRLVDGVADVLMGLVIDNTATRWGRCRPYLLIGAIPFGLLCILAFYVPDFGTTGKLILKP